MAKTTSGRRLTMSLVVIRALLASIPTRERRLKREYGGGSCDRSLGARTDESGVKTVDGGSARAGLRDRLHRAPITKPAHLPEQGALAAPQPLDEVSARGVAGDADPELEERFPS